MFNKLGTGFWLVAIITIFIVFSNLGGVPLLDPDEPVYAETPKEMFAFNEFVSPRIFGEYWYDKPPMYYWLVAASYKILGVNEFAARFPSAALAVVCALVVYWSGRRLFNERTGIASALVLATSIEYFYLGKAAVTDITLVLFLSLSLLSFIEKRYYSAYIFAGLATLTKGPIGLLFPGGIIFFYLLATRNWSLLKSMKIPFGLLVYALVAAPWYIIMYKIHGSIFIDTFLGFHNITRFTSPEHPELVLWYYYIPVLVLGFFPWTTIMLQSIWTSLTDSNKNFSILLFLNIWALFIFIFFTVSQTKLVSYILPMYPPLAMIVGWYIDKIWSSSRGNTRFISWPILLGLLTILFTAGMILGSKTMPILQHGIYITSGIFIVMALLVTYFTWRKEIGRVFWTQIIAMVSFSMVLVFILFPLAAPNFTTKNIAQEFTKQYDGTSPVYIVKFLHPGFTFYTNVYGFELKKDDDLNEYIQKSPRAYFILRQAEYDSLAKQSIQLLTVLSTIDDKVLLLKK